MSSVLQNGIALKYFSDKLKDDETIVRMALKNNGYAIIYVSQRLLDNPEIIKLGEPFNNFRGYIDDIDDKITYKLR